MRELKIACVRSGCRCPPPIQLPPGIVFPFEFVASSAAARLISGHGPQNPDGSLAQPLGRIGAKNSASSRLTPQRALTALSILGSLERAWATSIGSPRGCASSAW